MKKALVTGANGTVGRQLVRSLIAKGWDVVCFARSDVPSVTTLHADILKPETLDLKRVDGQIDTVFHLAAMMPDAKPDSPARFMDANAHAVTRLLESSAVHGVKNFVYASSVSVIGTPLETPQGAGHPLNPIHDYSVAKLCGELACSVGRSMGMNVSALRLASIYGPGMARNTVLPLFVDRALQGNDLSWHGQGTRSQDFVFVDDVANALLLAAEHKANGTYCIGSGVGTTMRQLAEEIAAQISGVKATPSGQPDPQDGVEWLADIRSATADFGYKPAIMLREGLQKYIRYARTEVPS